MEQDPRAFQSPEELQQLLRAMGGRMHYINRVAQGESHFAWWYAELLKTVAAMAPLLRDDALRAEFGDGWTEGTADDKRGRFLDLLAEHLPKK